MSVISYRYPMSVDEQEQRLLVLRKSKPARVQAAPGGVT